MTPFLLPALVGAGCPLATPALDAAGSPAAIHAPSGDAMALNNEGKKLYREGHYAQARARYLAAVAADPEFLGPALNAACALARQGKFRDAATEAAALARRAFVPMGREVLEAADLAPLHVRPEMKIVRDAIAEGGLSWGESLRDALFFVGRTRPPIRLSGHGVLVLGLGQEVFAYLPHAGRYRQVTVEDGRVLALARSADGRRIAYVRAGKLVRPERGPPALRGLSVRMLELGTMALSPAVDIPGDLVELAIGFHDPRRAELVIRPGAGRASAYAFDGESLRPIPLLRRTTRDSIVLTASGVADTRVVAFRPCGYRAQDFRRKGEPARVRIVPRRGKPFLLDARYGAGLAGLPFP